MKKIITLFFLFVAVTVFAQNNGAEDTIAKPAITAAGKPDGEKTEMKIGKEGGSFSSSDGKVKLIIPDGAISKKTTFTIQPITNMVPNGNGKAYRLEPSGIKFQQPVQLIFYYTDEEAADSMQLLMGIAMQDNTGQWHSLKKITLDTVAKTISGTVNHFSDWANFNAIKLYPSYTRLKVKKQLTLSIDLASSEDEELSPLSPDDELAPLIKKKIPWTSTWRANEIINGNVAVGKIDVGSKTMITYTAPAAVPAQNPVAITAELKGLKYKYKGTVFRELRLVSNILVYDNAYEVTMITSIDGMAGSELGKCTYKDTGSFVVSLNGKDTKIIEKVNKNTTAELDYKGKCTIIQLKPGSGNVHILGVQSIKVIPPATPNANSWIEIIFKHSPTIMPLLKITCPPIDKGSPTTITTAQANAMMFSMPAFPQLVKFEAKEGEHTILKMGQEGSELFLKFTVKQIKDE